MSVVGLEVTHRIAFQALVELIDAGTPGVDLLDLANDPAELGPALADAAQVLTAADLASAPTMPAGPAAVAGQQLLHDWQPTRRPHR